MKISKHFGIATALLTLALAGTALPVRAADQQPKRLLLVTVTTGFRHSSIPTAEKVLNRLSRESGAFTLDMVQQPTGEPRAPKKPSNPTPDQQAQYEKDQAAFKEAQNKWNEAVREVCAKLSPENLKNYDGVIFANTTGDLPIPDREGFLSWLKSGKAFIGMHSATDTFHGFRGYIDMIGGEFLSHGAQVSVDCKNEDSEHACCRHLGPNWTVYDEIYLMKSFDPNKVHRLLGLDKEPNKKTPGYFPVAWSKDYGQGKVFYTSLGHREDMWDDQTPAGMERKNSVEVSKAYQQHILGGIKWALGLEKGDSKPQPLQ